MPPVFHGETTTDCLLIGVDVLCCVDIVNLMPASQSCEIDMHRVMRVNKRIQRAITIATSALAMVTATTAGATVNLVGGE